MTSRWERYDKPVPILEYLGLYYCYADPVIGPILPGVFLTVPLSDPETGEVIGRDRVDTYPRVFSRSVPISEVPKAIRDINITDVRNYTWQELAAIYDTLPGIPYYDTMDFDDHDGCVRADISDPDGEDALGLGGSYYTEGYYHTSADEKEHQERLDCFKLAEILYRHSAGRGNVQGWVNLGYLYAYDRCEGRYYVSYLDAGSFDGQGSHGIGDDGEPLIRRPSIDELATECFRRAAYLDNPEACYKYGDMLGAGRGCVRDDEAAYKWYSRAASRATETDDDEVYGSAALRMARVLRDGKGCQQDLHSALGWYTKARDALGKAVDNGEEMYEERYAEAAAGVEDVAQELGE